MGLSKRECHSKTTNELLHKMKCNILRFSQVITLIIIKKKKKSWLKLDNSLISLGASLKENVELDMLADEREGGQEEGKEGGRREATFHTCSRNFLAGIF